MLKNALLQYEGCMILVSHDRDFLQGLSSKVFEFKDHHIKTYIGDVYDFLEKKKMDSLKELEKKVQTATTGEKGESSNKISWEKKKEEDAAKRKLKNRLNKLESEIAELQQQLTDIETKISNPADYAAEINSGELYTQYNQVKNAIEEKEMEWLELQE